MRIHLTIAALFLVGISAIQAAQTVNFWSDSGSSPNVNDSLLGVTSYDHLGSADYSGYMGELILMPSEPAILADAASDARGLAISDSDGIFNGTRGFVGFCIDSETPFNVSSDLSATYNYEPLPFTAAAARFSADPVAFYVTGGLKRAAYLLETYFDSAQSVGALGGASLQAGIWGVLYDQNPDVSTGSGNYFVRNNVGPSQKQSEADQIIAQVNGWYTEAAANDWGGAAYAPDENVIFWIDPEGTQANQSIISLRSEGLPLIPVPEPGVGVLMMGGLSMLTLARRRSC